jgi:Ca2+-binding EF-hand superfamily protein
MTINTIMQISPIQLLALTPLATSMVSAGPNIHARKQAKHDAMKDSGADFDRSVLDAMGEDEDWEDEDDYADDPDNWHHADLEDQEKLNRFTHMAKKMDANTDGFVDKSELITWTLKALQNMDMKELDEDWDVSDHDEDGYISWEEYVENIYGVEPADQEDFSVEQLENDAALQDYNRAYHREFSKFMAADANEDGKLSKEEYESFFNPGKNSEQTEYAVKEALQFVDKSGDGMINREEFDNDYKNTGFKKTHQLR